MSDSTARMRRERRRAALSRFLRSSANRHDVTQQNIVAVTGAKDSVVGRWYDPEARETPSVADVPALDPRVALDLVAWQLEQITGPGGEEYAVALLPAGAAIPSIQMGAAIKEIGEAISAFGELAEKGKTPRTSALAEKEINEAIAALLAWRGYVRVRSA